MPPRRTISVGIDINCFGRHNHRVAAINVIRWMSMGEKRVERARSVLTESMHSLKVAIQHPLGWGFDRLVHQPSVDKVPNPSQSTSNPRLMNQVFVHGVLHNATAFYSLERQARKRGFTRINCLELWTSFSNLHTMVEDLRQSVFRMQSNNVKTGVSDPRIQIVAHSLGGVVTRLALLDAWFAQCVAKVVFLGTPHQGIPKWAHWLPLPKSLRDFASNSRRLHLMKATPLPGNIRYWNIRGAEDIVTPESSTFLPHVPNFVLPQVGHAGLLSHPGALQLTLDLLESSVYPRERSV
jgi:hypothetical protein